MAKSLIRLDIESKEYERKLKQSRRQFEEFTASIGINMKKMTAYGIAVGAASAAINKLTDGIKQCISESVEMAKAGEGIRMAFERLNRPDLLDKLREATHNTVSDLDLMKQAVKFKDFRLDLDQLGAMLAFAQKKAADTGQSIDFLVESIVNGLGRQSKLILDNLGISAAEIDEEMKKTGDMTQAVGNIIKKQMEEAGDYVETAAIRAAQAEAALKNEMEALGRTMMPLTETGEELFTTIEIKALQALNNGIKPWIEPMMQIRDLMGELSSYTIAGATIWEYFGKAVEGTTNAASRMLPVFGPLISMLRTIRELVGGDGQGAAGGAGVGAAIGKAAAAAASAGNTATTPIVVPKVKTTTTKSSVPTYASDSIAAQQAEVSRLTKLWQEAGEGVRDYYLVPLINAENRLKSIKDQQLLLREQAQGRLLGGNIQTSGLGVSGNGKKGQIQQNTISFGGFSTIEGIGSGIDEKTLEHFNQLQMRGEQISKSFSMAAQATESLGAALSGIEDPGVKAAGTVLQAIANIALGFSSASLQATSMGPYGWIAYLAAGAAAMATTISTIHSLTGYAEGGRVEGNTYSGDQIPAMLNAGEIVLNQAQTSNVASALQEGGGRGLQVVGHLSGEDIILVANRTFRRKGQGEIVTWG